MNKTKLISLAAAGTICFTSVITGSLSVSAVQQTDPTSDVKIMALGDSITDGYWTGGGYRKYLYRELEQMGYSNIDMVGPKGGNSESFHYNGQSVTYDGNYAGYSGYAIQYITGTETRQGILETINSDYGNGQNMIEAYDPDVVLLQIGTNDILSNYNDGITDRLENLVDTILASMDGKNDLLYVSTIPDINVSERYDWLWAYGLSYSADPQKFIATVQECIDTYNASIQNLVAEKQAAGERIAFANIHGVVDQNTDLYDGVHPNEAGYENMGNYWANLLDTTYLNGKTTPVEPTEPVTTTVTSRQSTTTTTTKETTTSAKETTASTTTTAAQPVTTASTAKTTVDPDAKTIVLDDVKIGEFYDLTPYQNADLSAISFVFSRTPQYGMNGCVAFGNWEMNQNYTAENLTNNTLTVSLDKFYNAMVLYKWYGETELDSVILYFGETAEETTVTSTTRTTTTTTTTTTTASTQPTTTTTITTTQPTETTTTNTTAISTTTQPATTSDTQTTVSTEENTVVLTDVVFGSSYSLKDYNYQSINKIVIEFEGEIGYGFGGALVLGNWAVQNSYGHTDMTSNNTITFDVTNPQDRLTLFRYWGTIHLKSITLYFK